VFLDLVSSWPRPEDVVIGGREPPTLLTGAAPTLPGRGLVERAMFSDAVTYLPDDILAKVDRASMAVGLEARVPMLDHHLVELAWRLPLSQKVRGGQGKWLLRRVLAQHVPPQLFDRPKQGFGVPIGAWLRGPLRPWAEDLLDEERLRREGFLRPAPVRQLWQDHVSGRGDHKYQLWTVLMFQAWLAEQSWQA
jgi:asparagine synthase (glutamine-hydrolysing)